MDTQEPAAELDAAAEPARALRALTLIAASVLVIAATAVAYLHPSTSARRPEPVLPTSEVADQLGSVDFVTPTTGWFSATTDSGRFVVMGTTNAGRTWTRQLGGRSDRHSIFMRFFDSTHGMFALMGTRAEIYETGDGGHTWSSRWAISASANVLSMSFTDPLHGWLVIISGGRFGATVLRTSDGGRAWTNLGSPVVPGDQLYRIHFTDAKVGWLDTLSARPYAYRSADGGSTWRRVALPAPKGGWPAAGRFVVAAQPTQGVGVVATVVNFAPTTGRSGIGGTVTAYPPLTVATFDGGVPVTYHYTTLTDAIASWGLTWIPDQNSNASSPQVQAPGQVQLGSLDGGATWSLIAPPAAPGAIGYSDAASWWWIGSGAWASSSDGGTTWTPYRNIGVLQPLPGSLQVLDPQHAWFGAMAGGKSWLERTEDGGIRWEMISLPPIHA